MSALEWRPMGVADIGAVVAVARLAFPDHFEARECFEERLSLFPEGCFALAGAEGVKGYLIAYPWPPGSVPPLDSLLGALPRGREAFYLHDLAFDPDVRGQGHARPVIARLAAQLRAGGARRIALVSVNNSRAFWQGMGFEPIASDATARSKLESYGSDATYMVREL